MQIMKFKQNQLSQIDFNGQQTLQSIYSEEIQTPIVTNIFNNPSSQLLASMLPNYTQNQVYVPQLNDIQQKQTICSEITSRQENQYEYKALTQQNLEVLQSIEEIMYRALSRKFFNNIKFFVMKKLEFLLQQAQKVQIIQVVTTSDWIYRKLFQKTKPTQQETMFKQFLHHCAVIIQSNFKSYITSKRHKIVMKRIRYIKSKLVALVKGWKVRQILKSKKIVTLRRDIKQIQQQIDSHINRGQINKKFNYLNKQLNINVELFNEQFQILYRTGGWIFSKSLQVYQPLAKLSANTNLMQPKKQNLPKENKTKRTREFKVERNIPNQQKKNQEPNQIIEQNHNVINSQFDERPIKSVGVYTIDDNNIETVPTPVVEKKKVVKKVVKEKPKPKEQIIEVKQTQEIVIQEPEKKQQKERPKKLVKKQKYDPRKAIQQQKKKKNKKKEQQKNVVTQIEQNDEIIEKSKLIQKNKSVIKEEKRESVTQKYLKPKKQKTQRGQIQQSKDHSVDLQQMDNRGGIRTSILQKSKKKVSSKVDCWSKKKQNLKTNPQRKYYSKFTQNIIHNFQQSQDTYQRIQQQQEVIVNIQNNNQFRIAREYENEYEQEYQFQKKRNNEERLTKVTKNMQKILQKLDEKKQDNKKNVYRPIQELQYTYENQYKSRFQKIMPKLQILFFERNQEKYPAVPIVLTKSLFGESLSKNLDYQSFRKLSAKLEKRYRAYLDQFEK